MKEDSVWNAAFFSFGKAQRKKNEDQILIYPSGLTDRKIRNTARKTGYLSVMGDMVIAAVFDGITHSCGHVSSRVAKHAFYEAINSFPEEAVAFSPEAALSLLKAAILAANQSLLHYAEAHPYPDGSLLDVGATVSAALICRSTVITANLGDSPILLYHCGDHSIEPLFSRHQDGHGYLRRFLGYPGLTENEISTSHASFLDSHILLLGSDGALERLSYPCASYADSDYASLRYAVYLEICRNGAGDITCRQIADEIRKTIEVFPGHDDDSSLIVIRDAQNGR